MESFSRLVAILLAVFMLIPFAFLQRLHMAEARWQKALTNDIEKKYAQIKNKRELTATDMVDLYEIASLYGGNLSISIGKGCEEVVENNIVFDYTDRLYLEDIQDIIDDYGKITLLPGDSISLGVITKYKQSELRLFSGRGNKAFIGAGGLI